MPCEELEANDRLCFSRSLETCTSMYWTVWTLMVRSRRCICQEDIHHATMWIGGHCHRKMNLHHRIQSNFLKSYPNPDDRASAGSEFLFSTLRRRRCNFATYDECDRRRRRNVRSAQNDADDCVEPFLSPILWKHIPGRLCASPSKLPTDKFYSLRPRGIFTYMLAVIAERGARYERKFAISLWRCNDRESQ